MLRDLIVRGVKVDVMAIRMGKGKEAVLKKIERLNFKVVQQKNALSTTSNEMIMPKELPSVEEALITLARALEALKQPSLERAEVLRLKAIIQAAKIYQDLLADYIDYRRIETKLLDLETKYARLVSTKQKETSSPSKTISPTQPEN